MTASDRKIDASPNPEIAALSAISDPYAAPGRFVKGQLHVHSTWSFDGWLSLPPDFIAALGLRWQRFGRAVLADGSESVFNIYRGVVLWDGQPQTILIYEMDAEPLIGMSLMYGYELVLPVLDGATFSLRRIANP